MSSRVATQVRPILESWKEISDYLRRSVKTCQRWELELGLPIHRLDGTPNARVFAYPDELDRWIREKLHPLETEAPRSVLVLRLKKGWVAAAAGVLVVFAVAAGLAGRFLVRKPAVFPLTTYATLAVLPFENVTGEEDLEAWRSALPELFHAKFLQSMTVGVPGGSQPWAALRKLGLQDARKFSPEDLKRVSAAIWSTGYVATGNLIRSDEDIIIGMSLRDSKTGESIQSFRAICRGERGIFTAVDDLTRKIKLALNVPPRLVSRDIDDKVSEIVTGSPQALMSYCQGLRRIREGRFGEAVPFFERATEADPEFSDAYYQMFTAHYASYIRSGDRRARTEALRCGEKALSSIHRLNAWTRGFLIENYLLRLRKDYDRAVAEYKKLLNVRGGDPIVLLQIAQIYSTMDEYPRVLTLLENERARQDSRNVVLLANAYLLTGRADKAEKLLDGLLNKNPKASPTISRARAMCALSQGKYDEALAFMDRAAMARNPMFIESGKAPVFITQDDFASAEKELGGFLDQPNLAEAFNALCGLAGIALSQGRVERARSLVGSAAETAAKILDWHYRKRAHFLSAYLYRLSGDLPGALRETEKACPCYEEDDFLTDPESRAEVFSDYEDISCLPYFHLRALITLEMGRVEEFDRLLAEIKQLAERSPYARLLRAYYHLAGLRELRASHFDDAVDLFWKALKLLPFPRALRLWPSLAGDEYDIDSTQYFFSLAEAYYQAGRYWSALDLYKNIVPYWDQRPASGDLYARSFYRMAKIYDQGKRPSGTSADEIRADKALAIENYRKFLSLFGNADPLFAAEVEDARARLAVLEAGPSR